MKLLNHFRVFGVFGVLTASLVLAFPSFHFNDMSFSIPTLFAQGAGGAGTGNVKPEDTHTKVSAAKLETQLEIDRRTFFGRADHHFGEHASFLELANEHLR